MYACMHAGMYSYVFVCVCIAVSPNPQAGIFVETRGWCWKVCFLFLLHSFSRILEVFFVLECEVSKPQGPPVSVLPTHSPGIMGVHNAWLSHGFWGSHRKHSIHLSEFTAMASNGCGPRLYVP